MTDRRTKKDTGGSRRKPAATPGPAAAGAPPGRRSARTIAMLLVGLLVLGAGAVLALRHFGSTRPHGLHGVVRSGQAAGYNVLLVTLDTVRRDHLGCYGDTLARTPTLDSLAAHGVRVVNAEASVPITLPSHATILTGLYPPHHGVRDNGRDILSSSKTTLAKTLQDRGYETAAFVGCFVLDGRFGLNQGFSVYDFSVAPEGYRPNMVDFNERPANDVTDAAVAWFRGRAQRGSSQPFFTWVHYFDAHQPYQSPLASRPEFRGRPYDAEISFVDLQLGRLLAELRREGLLERTVIAVAADHGESLGEHGEPTHSMLLYSACMRVPLLFSCPTVFRRPTLMDGMAVGLVDIRPTLEDLLGLPITQPCDGISLLAARIERSRSIYLETLAPFYLAGWSPLHGLGTVDRKSITGPVPRSFDLLRDPGETANIHGSPEARPLEEELDDVVSRYGEGTASGRVMTDEELERLHSLGYIGGPAEPANATLADPETMMPVYRQALQAETFYRAGMFDQAADLASTVLKQPGAPGQALRVLAFSRIKQGRGSEAIDLLRRSVGQRGDVFLVRSLVQALLIEKRFPEAEEALQVYADLDSTDGRVPLLRGDCLAGLGHTQEAMVQYRLAARLDPNRVGPQAEQRLKAAGGATDGP